MGWGNEMLCSYSLEREKVSVLECLAKSREVLPPQGEVDSEIARRLQGEFRTQLAQEDRRLTGGHEALLSLTGHRSLFIRGDVGIHQLLFDLLRSLLKQPHQFLQAVVDHVAVLARC